MGMAEAINKAVKAEKPKIDDKAANDAATATLLALTKTGTQKAAAVKAPSAVQAVQKSEEKAVKAKVEAVNVEPVKEAPKAEAIKAEPPSEVKTEALKAEVKKEADPSKEFVDGIMTEMALKGASKKRLIKKLAEQFNFDKQKVLFRLRRALITERYAVAHEASGH